MDRSATASGVFPPLLLLWALATGVVGGLGAVLFRLMIRWAGLVFGAGWQAAGGRWWERPLEPAAGLLVVSLISHYLAREVKGHGVPQILEALALRGGRIRPRVGILGIIAPAVTIGSGGSVGREGPIALIGAAFGSTVGQLFQFSDRDTILLLACGAAAGIGATFNAPLAGGFFGLEVILGTYALGAMVPVFLASVAGDTVFTAIMGGGAVLATPPYHIINHFAPLFMMGLGVLTALAGYAYTRGLDGSETWFDRLPWPFWVKALAGGAAVGLLGLAYPQVLGVGYPTMHQALDGHLVLVTLLALLLAKYVATLITIGAGGSGGVFAPSLFLGGMLGGTYGAVLHAISPSLAPHPPIYAVAGMAALFAASAQAPFVAVTILLEVTGDYHLTSAVIAAAAVSYFLYAMLTRDSMYTVKLSRRGIKILRGNDVRPVDAVPVTAAMEPVREAVRDTDPVSVAYTRLLHEEREALPVVDGHGNFIGLVRLADLAGVIGREPGRQVGEVAAPVPPPVGLDASLDTALRRLTFYRAEALPVAGRDGRTAGMVTMAGALNAYYSSALTTIDTAARVRSLQAAATDDPGAFVEVVVGERSPVAGRTLAEAGLPADAIVLSVRPRGQGPNLVPHGQTRLQAGDRVLVYVAPSARSALVRQLLEGSA
ncbi:Chloride channel protein, CIC family [Candidatus Hydrogenisulfobacillus filiaventi]|uniref:Chloride channel protein, CIC family n=1 Tax=Candidatus Hydrogenisulfobacillus filiaventi TaxID=2707344 RepID=A0A6F8ZJL8_9FIRM|nr:Chloride channel protein, CIC family [Candidatus Hydrogenisulfobacillus filiaventi]